MRLLASLSLLIVLSGCSNWQFLETDGSACAYVTGGPYGITWGKVLVCRAVSEARLTITPDGTMTIEHWGSRDVKGKRGEEEYQFKQAPK